MKIDPNGLLSKWGFGDGDMLDDLLYENGYEDAWKDDADKEEGHWFDHRILVRVIEEHVVPKLDQVVETFTVWGIHNPIRADNIDGIKFTNWYRGEVSQRLTPSMIEVTDDVILAIAEREKGQ